MRIPVSQVEAMRSEIHKVGRNYETGGIIIGRDALEQYDATVLGAPGPNAIHRSDYFLRDLSFAQDLALQCWNSNKSEWIGEWHTHPHSGLAPSEADIRTYRQHLRDPELHLDAFLSVISKLRGKDLLVAAWVVTSNKVERLSVEVIVDDLRPEAPF